MIFTTNHTSSELTSPARFPHLAQKIFGGSSSFVTDNSSYARLTVPLLPAICISLFSQSTTNNKASLDSSSRPAYVKLHISAIMRLNRCRCELSRQCPDPSFYKVYQIIPSINSRRRVGRSVADRRFVLTHRISKIAIPFQTPTNLLIKSSYKFLIL